MKVEDLVKIKFRDHSKLTDFQADLISMLSDREISGQTFDKVIYALEINSTWKIISIDENNYCDIKLKGVKNTFLLSNEDLISVV